MKNINTYAQLKQKRNELANFINLHYSERVMRDGYSYLSRILTRQVSYISKHRNGDYRIQKLDHGSINRFSHTAENLYFSLAMYPNLFINIVTKAGYEVFYMAAEGSGKREVFLRIADIAFTTDEDIWYKIKPDVLGRLCDARDLLKEEIKKQIEDLTNEVEGEGGIDKKGLQLSSFNLENKVIVVNEYFDHDMFQIKDIIKPDMKLDISADSSEEEVETAMLGRVSDMYLEEILEKSKSNLEFVTVDIDVVTNKIEKILSEELYIVQDSQIVRYSGNNIASDDVYVSVKSLHRAELNVLCSTNRIGPILYLKGNSDDNYREGGSILKMSAETRSKLIRETICKKKADLEADISKIVSAKSLSAKDKKQWLSQNCHLDIYILTVDKKID